MKKYLVVGSTSFIGQYLNRNTFDKISYKDLHDNDLSKYHAVVNCALDPKYKTSEYDEEYDFDLKVGKKCLQNNCHYVMLSTSKVYGKNENLVTYTEESSTNPFDNYSKNKLQTEQTLQILFANKKNLTILRGSNIFGYEPGRNSFMGYCLSQLEHNDKVQLSISSGVKRDFIYVEDAVDIIEKVCEIKPFGIYNLSSNYGLETGRIIENLSKGYNYIGSLEHIDNKIDRQFILDNSKLQKNLGIKIGPYDFNTICYNIGKKLCKI
jgi:nucleoside-diphosphate-sugar epimerase